MPAHVVGLDIGTHAVRAAELAIGKDEATLARFGQVALPAGAVRDGEVVDPTAVSDALRRLWAEAGFKGRDVVVGVGNQRVVVRQAELPDLPESDLRSALKFEVQELIPIPVDEALLDYQVVEKTVGEDNQPQLKVLLVAAQKDMVQGLLESLEGADLNPKLVDVAPFALLRALFETGVATREAATGRAEAIVCVGGGVTTVVVHEGGVPRFVRMLTVGGSGITEAIAEELHVDLDVAEGLKRRARAESHDELEARAGHIVWEHVTPLLEEIRGSLDYHLAQPDAAPISRVLLTGGGSLVFGLGPRLQEQLGLPVEAAHPLSGLRIGQTGISDDRLHAAEPLLAVPVGLALAGRPADHHRLSLLPQEVAHERQQKRLSSMVGVGVGVVALGLGGAWLYGTTAVSDAKSDLKAAQAQVDTLQRQEASLQPVATLRSQLAQREAVVRQALDGDVDFNRLMREVAASVPEDVWISSFAATRGNATTPGTITVGANGIDHTSTARWIISASKLPSLVDVWVDGSSRSTGTGPVTFNSTATLTDAAKSDRLTLYVEGPR